jgi:uncharacterized protein YgiM (DUF1202 family)
LLPVVRIVSGGRVLKRLVAGFVVAGLFSLVNHYPTSLSHAGSIESMKPASAASAATPNDIVQTARQYLGSPYAYIGNTPAGFSCIGFVNFVFHQNGVYVPFDIPMAWSGAPHVDRSELMPGDILFFSNTVFAGLSHVAVYIGNNQMIGADSYSVGVTIDQVDDSYWSAHYTGATRPLAAYGTSPAPGQAPVATATPTSAQAPSASAASSSPMAGNGAVVQPTTASVSLFSGPGYEYVPVASLAASALLTVMQSQEGWYDVRTAASVYGWVTAGSVRVTSAAASTAPADLSKNGQGLSQAAAISGAKPLGVMYVAVGPLWVRSGPGQSFGSLGYVVPGSQVSVYLSTPHWAKVVTPSGLQGWVATQYLTNTPFTQASTAQTAVTGPQARVVAPALNVRALPDSHARVISVLFSGEVVPVLAQRTGWNEVRLRTGTIGWASTKYLITK